MAKYRAAVIGCGRAGFEFLKTIPGEVFAHTDAYVKCSSTELVAVCDVDEIKLESCAAYFGVPGFASVQELLRVTSPEIVSICTSADSHLEVAREVLPCPSVRAVLCEKPLATSVDSARELVTLASEEKKVLAVNHGRRYAQNMKALREFLVGGGVGRIQVVRGVYSGGLLNNGSHWIDLLRFLTDHEVTDVKVSGGGLATDNLDVQMYLHGIRASLCASGAGYSIFEMDVLGSEGRVLLTDSCHQVRVFKPANSQRYAGFVELELLPRHFGDRNDMTLHAVEDLAESLEQNRPPACTGRDGLEAVWIVMIARATASRLEVTR